MGVAEWTAKVYERNVAMSMRYIACTRRAEAINRNNPIAPTIKLLKTVIEPVEFVMEYAPTPKPNQIATMTAIIPATNTTMLDNV